jgi:hypothetical protein
MLFSNDGVLVVDKAMGDVNKKLELYMESDFRIKGVLN